VNVLLLDTQIYPSAGAPSKKDVGLYALNYGNTYVASVAMYRPRIVIYIIVLQFKHLLQGLISMTNTDTQITRMFCILY